MKEDEIIKLKELKKIHQLFIGMVSSIIGVDETIKLLTEATDTIKPENACK